MRIGCWVLVQGIGKGRPARMTEWDLWDQWTYERRRSAANRKRQTCQSPIKKKHAPIHRFYLVWCLGDLIAPIAGAETTEADDIGAEVLAESLIFATPKAEPSAADRGFGEVKASREKFVWACRRKQISPNGPISPIRGYSRSGTRFPNADTPTRSFPLDSREKTAKINQHIPDYDRLNRF